MCSSISFFFLSGVCMWYGIYLLLMSGMFYVEWTVFSVKGVNLEFVLFFDWMSLMFFSFVSVISSAVFLFSESYMHEEKKKRLFVILVVMFVFSMFFMVFSLNLISLMLGWDGLGLVSYVLVIYYQNSKANAAGSITALSNRVGDAALMVSIAIMLESGSWDIYTKKNVAVLTGGMLTLAAMTKSAQIPFSAWLPAAMAAPTPVSALVHSSTLVTAGVYLLIRFFPAMSSSYLFILIVLGGLTALMAGLNALFEMDLKKMVALSTLSQLGLMMVSLGFGFPMLAYFHLLMHALFKALLFLCSGKIIHMVQGEQDLRSMGGLLYNLPITSVVLNLSNFALCGFPFLAGFYSKDLMVELILMEDNYLTYYFFFSVMLGVSVTYSLRLSFFSLKSASSNNVVSSSEEEDWAMLGGKFILASFSVLGGSIFYWLVAKVFWVVSLPLYLKWFTFLSVLAGVFLSSWMMKWNLSKKDMKISVGLEELNNSMWGLSILSGSEVLYIMKTLGAKVGSMNKGWFEMLGGEGFHLGLAEISALEVKISLAFFKYFLVFSLMLLFFMS